MKPTDLPPTGGLVVLKVIPQEFLTGLPQSDQAAIRAQKGRRVRLVAYDAGDVPSAVEIQRRLE